MVQTSEFGFDYLRDNMVVYKEELVQRGLNYAIVPFMLTDLNFNLVLNSTLFQVKEINQLICMHLLIDL